MWGLSWLARDEQTAMPSGLNHKSLYRGLNRVQSCVLSRWSQQHIYSQAWVLKATPAVETVVVVVASHSVLSNSLWPHGLQRSKLSCPSPTPRAWSDSCPLSRWCHPTISSSVIPFSFRLQSFPASGSFPVSQFFASGGQSIGASASASVLPMNIQGWFPSGLTGVWSPCSPRDSQESSSIPQFKSINSSALSFLYSPTLTSIHEYWRNHSLTRWTLLIK